MTPEDVEERLASDDPADRRDAVRALRGWPGRHALPLLLAAIEDEAEKVSGQAAWMLASLATGEAIPALLGQYTHPDRFLGTYVYDVPYYSGLEELGAAGVAAPAVDAVAEATDGEIVWVLGLLGDPLASGAVEQVSDDLEAFDGSGWRYRALVANAERAVTRLQEAADREGTRG